MMAFDWKKSISVIAPAIGTALGGPLAGSAVRAVSELFFGKPHVDEIELNKAVENATPEQLIKLKQLNYQFEQLAVEQFRSEVDDRISAREIITKTGDHTQRNLSYLIIGAYFCFMFKVIWDGGISEGEREVLNALVNIVFLVVGFWFGSSRGSQRKDALK
jgi:hypothetical protein